MKEFIDYVLSFYGKSGIYDMNMTRKEVSKAIDIRLICDTYRQMPFEGDSFDREAIRDIILTIRG